jgi:hypothetical protein
MQNMLHFHQLYRDIAARQVEYSFAQAEDEFTTMIPVSADCWPKLESLSAQLAYPGQWLWSVRRFSASVNPDAYLFRVDWARAEPVALTLYCRFPVEPSAAGFGKAMVHAKPFEWSGPDVEAISKALDTAGPRGIAFRVSARGTLRSALYYRCDLHGGRALNERLPPLLDACGYGAELSSSIEGHLKPLYQPGPAGVIGIDNGTGGVAGALKFDPANVPLPASSRCLANMGVARSRIAELERFARGLRAQSATYLGVQFNRTGLSGWRLYFACEPARVRGPDQAIIATQQYLRPAHRAPHY